MPTPPLDHLDAERVQVTITHLSDRVQARFPARGIARTAPRLHELATEVADVSGSSRFRLRLARLITLGLAVALVVATAVVVAVVLRHVAEDGAGEPEEWLALLESGVNDLVFSALAIWFLMMVPARIERRRMLSLLHRLRSLAHVIDMHQLTKDPEHLRDDYVPTDASVLDPMTRDQMGMYLEYCTELLSLVGKVAALCAESSDDDIVLETVTGIESLTSDLSGTIRQKIALLPT